MVEKLQQGSEMDLESHLQDLNGALAVQGDNDNSDGGSGSAKDDPMVDAIITAPLAGVSMFVAFLDGMAGGNRDTRIQSGQGSHFVNIVGTERGPNAARQRPTPTPLVPLTYGEKKQQAARASKMDPTKALRDGNLFTGVRIAGMSVADRGDSTDASRKGKPGDKKDNKRKHSLKGVKVTPDMARSLGLASEILAEIAATMLNMEGQNRYNSSKRLLNDLRKGSQSAKKAVEKKPQLLTQQSGTA